MTGSHPREPLAATALAELLSRRQSCERIAEALVRWSRGMAVTVTRLYDPAGAEQYFGPRRGRKYVDVDLVLKNTGTKAYNDSPGNGATLLDTRDHGYTEALSETTSCQSIGYSVKIAPGSKRAGRSDSRL